MIERGYMTSRAARLIPGALILGLLASTIALKFTEYFAQGADGNYGAPIPVGRSGFAGYLAVPGTFSAITFAVDAAITCVPFIVIAVWSGSRILGISFAAGIASFVLPLLASVFSLGRIVLPLLPVPLNPLLPQPFVVWLDMLLWAIGAALIARWITRRRSRA